MPPNPTDLLKKIAELPAERIAEVEDFVDFLRMRDQDRAAEASAASFAAIWDNLEDAAYDVLSKR